MTHDEEPLDLRDLTPDESEGIALLFRLGLGPWLTPLRGKIPLLDAWESLPERDEATVRQWVAAGFNIGLRTGARSGLVVIDDDRAKHGLEPFDLPPTGLVQATPTGGRHAFYRLPAGAVVRNSASKLAPYVDVRGEGGQVAVAPSVHPVVHKRYQWLSTGEPAPWPAELVPRPAPQPASGAPGYAQSALVREVAAVRVAPEGTRNDALNRAAFSLGQLVAGGALAEADVVAELAAAARIAGLPEREAASTIASGLRGGAAKPRTAPERPERSQRVPGGSTATAPAQPVTGGDVLVPGAHVLPTGEYVEQGTDDFARECLARIPPGALYRRGGIVGEIHGAEFAPVTAHRIRSIVDEHARLVAGKPGKDGEAKVIYQTCSRDLAGVLLDYGSLRGEIRELRQIATHPVCVGRDFDAAVPGWNASSGVWLASDVRPVVTPLDESLAVLTDALADFPFQAPADLANYIGLLLTPILRPAIDEPVPMHVIVSPIERSGKTKLAEIVFGTIVAGRRVPAMQLGEREEEREKRILAVLVRGQTILHLDNLREFVDSPALASLLTSSEFQGRLLGSSTAPSLPNTLTVVGTGNNVHATGEISKRIVPVRLMPATESPETRTDFRHSDLLAFVRENRERILGALLGLIEHWRASGRPLHRAAFGGFERWTAVVGGILHAAGMAEWLTNMAEWRGAADDSGQEFRALILAWHARYACEWVETAALYELATELDLFGWLDGAKSERAKRTSFGVRVLNRVRGRTFGLDGGGKVRVDLEGVGVRRRARLGRLA